MAFTNNFGSVIFWFSCSSLYLYYFLKNEKINILGISAFFHDSAVALLQNGEIKYASQEERFSELNTIQVFQLIDLLRFNNF